MLRLIRDSCTIGTWPRDSPPAACAAPFATHTPLALASHGYQRPHEHARDPAATEPEGSRRPGDLRPSRRLRAAVLQSHRGIANPAALHVEPRTGGRLC